MSRRPLSYLIDTHPTIASELVDKSDISSISTKSMNKMQFRCEKGHVYVSTPARRVGGSGCPYCSGRLPICGVDDLATLRPDLAERLVDKNLATQLKPLSSMDVEWECEQGHRFVDRPFNVSRRENFCPKCDAMGARRLGRRPDAVVRTSPIRTRVIDIPKRSKTDGSDGSDTARTVEAIAPNLVSEMVDETNKTLFASSSKKIEWRCSEGHVWSASVASRVRMGSGCPYCSGRLPIPGENDLATLEPEVASRLVDKSLASGVGVGSGKRLEFVCPNDETHVYMSPVRVQVKAYHNGTSGCPICSKHLARGKHRNELFEVEHPDLMEEALDKGTVRGLSSGSGKIVSWVCDKHGDKPFVYEMSIKKRHDGQGCPICGHHVVVCGINDLATTDPDLAAELVNPRDGYCYSRGSEQKVEWHCKNGHRWFASICSRVSGNGCPECSLVGSSDKERDLYEVVKLLVGDDEVILHDHSLLGRREVDIVIPSRKVAIEFNGLYWHSVDAGKTSSYHLDKYVDCASKGYRLIQVWEDDWDFRRDVVIAMVARKLGVLENVGKLLPEDAKVLTSRHMARKCEGRVIDSGIARDFLDRWHIQGRVTATYHFGLFDGDALVAVMSVRRPGNSIGIYHEKDQWEIQRYATAGIVAGGFSKLLAYATRWLLSHDETVASWMTFSANDVSDGDLYAKCGFVRAGESKPMYCYAGRVTGNRRVGKSNFRRKRFRDDPNLVWDESWTEFRAARENGLWRIYDAGKVRWVKLVGC